MAASRAKYGTPRAEVESELSRTLKAAPPPRPRESSRAEVPEESQHIEPAAVHADTSPQSEAFLSPWDTSPTKPVAVVETPTVAGKGGRQHKYLQHLIRGWAQERGWLATVEFPVKNGMVDVSLERDGKKIACEISVTTATEHEAGNVRKCLDAGYDFVALVVEKEKRISGLEKILHPKLSESEQERLRVVTVEGLCSFIEELDAQDASRSDTIRGYKVKVNRRAVDPIAKEERKAILSKIVAESLRQKKELLR